MENNEGIALHRLKCGVEFRLKLIKTLGQLRRIGCIFRCVFRIQSSKGISDLPYEDLGVFRIQPEMRVECGMRMVVPGVVIIMVVVVRMIIMIVMISVIVMARMIAVIVMVIMVGVIVMARAIAVIVMVMVGVIIMARVIAMIVMVMVVVIVMTGVVAVIIMIRMIAVVIMVSVLAVVTMAAVVAMVMRLKGCALANRKLDQIRGEIELNDHGVLSEIRNRSTQKGFDLRSDPDDHLCIFQTPRLGRTEAESVWRCCAVNDQVGRGHSLHDTGDQRVNRFDRGHHLGGGLGR